MTHMIDGEAGVRSRTLRLADEDAHALEAKRVAVLRLHVTRRATNIREVVIEQ